MSVIKLPLRFEGSKKDKTLCTLFDSGANLSCISDEFLVIPGLSEEAIIGAATMQKWRIKLDFENVRVIVDPKVAKLQLV